jgi:hypothetical protein
VTSQSEDHLPKGVTHQQQVGAGTVEQSGHGGVVRGQHDDAFAVPFHQSNIRNAHLLGAG